jgi:hypothetical protein
VNGHLKTEQFDDLVLGIAESEAVAHAAACPQCRAEIETLHQTLAAFRGAAVNWSVDAARPIALPKKQKVVPVRARFAWAGAAAAVLLALMVPLSVWRERRSASDAQAQLARDNQLLAHIDSVLGDSTPTSMQPLQVNPETRSR